MKHPFWLVNSLLLFLFIATLGFVFLSRQKRPRKVVFISTEPLKPIKKELPKIDPSKIYLNDLFGTYRAPIERPIISDDIKPLPAPPEQKKPSFTPKPQPKFLDPLPISLRGIMIMSDEKDNVAVLEENKTKKSTNYRVGDKIVDSQLIRIMRNKIILVRSNGQQETLYLSKYDAEIEELLSPNQKWDSVIKKDGEYAYIIDPDAFIVRVRNLAQLIDMLNLTTVYKKGSSIGNRIGKLTQDSIGQALGLKTGDIITHINNIPSTDTNKRFDIYQQIIKMKQGDTITINITRRGIPATITYTLQAIHPEKSTENTLHMGKTPYELEEEKIKIMQEKKKFAQQARRKNRETKRNMFVHADPKNNRFARERNRNVLTQ